jgi:hypothetical protein
MSLSSESILDHIADYLKFISGAQSFWYMLNTSYNHDCHLASWFRLEPNNYEVLLVVAGLAWYTRCSGDCSYGGSCGGDGDGDVNSNDSGDDWDKGNDVSDDNCGSDDGGCGDDDGNSDGGRGGNGNGNSGGGDGNTTNSGSGGYGESGEDNNQLKGSAEERTAAALSPRPSVAVAVTVRKIIGLKKNKLHSVAHPAHHPPLLLPSSPPPLPLPSHSPPPILSLPPPPPPRGTSRACRPCCRHAQDKVGPLVDCCLCPLPLLSP